jgi:YHS domain-containing protein
MNRNIIIKTRGIMTNRLRKFFSRFQKTTAAKTEKDPVCGMKATTGISSAYQGKTYYFCSDHCRQQFDDDPQAYV